jgi:hypothetical protein
LLPCGTCKIYGFGEPTGWGKFGFLEYHTQSIRIEAKRVKLHSSSGLIPSNFEGNKIIGSHSLPDREVI